MEYGVILISLGLAFYVTALVAMWKTVEEHFIPKKGKVWFQLVLIIGFFVIGFWLISGGLKLMAIPG